MERPHRTRGDVCSRFGGTRPANRYLARLAGALLAACFLPVSAVCAAEASSADGSTYAYTRGKTPALMDAGASALRVKASRSGSIRVFVELDHPMVLEGELPAEAGRIQAEQLRVAQNALITRALGAASPQHDLRTFRGIPFIAVTVTPPELEQLMADRDVFWIGEVSSARPAGISLTPVAARRGARAADYDFNVELIRAPYVWQQGLKGNGRVIAILDTGVNGDDPMLEGKILEEACFTSTSDGKPGCPNGTNRQFGPGAAAGCTKAICDHGMAVATVAAGREFQSAGTWLAGVAPSAKLFIANVFSKDGAAREDDVVEGLEWVYSLRNDYPKKIAAVNLSLELSPQAGMPCDDGHRATATILEKLRNIGVIAVAAGQAADGSPNGTQLFFPACISTALAVGASSATDQMTSSWTQALDLRAPGVVSAPNAQHGIVINHAGTSFATPHVSGAAAVLRQLSNSADNVITALKCSGPGVGLDANHLTPRLDLTEALVNYLNRHEEGIGFPFAQQNELDDWRRVRGIVNVKDGAFRVEFDRDGWQLTTYPNCRTNFDLRLPILMTGVDRNAGYSSGRRRETAQGRFPAILLAITGAPRLTSASTPTASTTSTCRKTMEST